MKCAIAWKSIMHSPFTRQRELLGMMQDSHRIRVSPVLLSKQLLRAERQDTHKLWVIASPFVGTWSAGLLFSNVKCTVTQHSQVSDEESAVGIPAEEEQWQQWSLLATLLMRLQTLLGDFSVVKAGSRVSPAISM